MMDRREYVQDAVDKLYALWLRRVSVSGSLLFLLLSFLDFTVFPEHFRLFLAYRIAIALFLLLIFGLARKTTNKTALRYYGLAAVTASAVTIEAMILHTGGENSLYAMGMVLLTVTALAFVPADFAFHSAMAGIIYGIYLLPIIMTDRIDDMPVFFTANFFICSIILTVLAFRYMTMQTIRQQLLTEYELLTTHDRLRNDITARRLAESALQEYQEQLEEMVEKRTAEVVESERKYQNLFELSGDAIIVADLETGIILDANQNARELLKRDRSDLIGMPQSELIAPEDVTRYQGSIPGTGTGETPQPAEQDKSFMVIGKNGRNIPVEISSKSLELLGGPVLVSVFKDLRWKKMQEKELSILKKAIDTLPLGITIVDRQGSIIYVNNADADLHGYERSDLIGKKPVIYAPPDQIMGTPVSELLQSDGFQIEYFTRESENIRKDGSVFPVEISSVPIRDNSGEPIAVISVCKDISERKQAELALRESERYYRTLFEKASEGIIFLTENLTITAVNRAFAEMHGYRCDELLNTHINSLDAAGLFQKDSDINHRLMAGESLRFEAEHYHAAGHTFLVEVLASLIELNNQKLFLCFHHDITDRKKDEMELQEKEARMRAMLESFDGLIYICSPEYRVEFMNENLVRRTGRNAVGERCYAVMNDRDTICPWCVNERVFRGEIVRYEIQSPLDNRWYHVVNTPIRHEDDSTSKLAMFLDVTETRKADIALKESEKRYRRLIRSVTDYIYTVAVRDGRPGTIEHGEGCFAVTGYTAAQHETDPDLWHRMVYVTDRDSVSEQTRAVLSGKKTMPLEHRIVHRSGSIRWVRHIIVPLFDKNQKLLSFDGLISDITERKLLEEQLEKARALEEENLKVFSKLLLDVQEDERRSIARELHDEIGQSLTGLKLSVENIADSLPPEQGDDLRAVEVSLGELISLVRSISLDLRPAMLDDFGLVNTLRWYFERYRLQTGISVNFIRTGEDRRFGPHKEVALYRITQESLTNAARYAGVKSIVVELVTGQDMVTLSIKDCGRGFDMTGSAMSISSGLSIMRERSILLKGTFSINSAPGQGTEITVTLPLTDTGD